MTRTLQWWLALGLVFVSHVTDGLQAQQEDKPFQNKIVELRKERLAEELNLSKEKESAIMKMYGEFVERERDLMQQRGELFKRLVHMSALAEDVSEDKVLKAIDELQEAERKIQNHHDGVVAAMKKELKPWQLGRFILFEERFHQKMRQMMMDMKGGKSKKWKRFDAPPPHGEFEDKIDD